MSTSTRTHVIRPESGARLIFDASPWRYRELFYQLVWRDVKVRYKQTALGAAWAILQPVVTMVVFTLFFGKLASIPSQDVPYPLFSMAALLPWTLFAQGVARGSESVVGSAALVTKVYFPRLLVPTAAVTGSVVDFLCALVVLVGMMVYYQTWGGWAVVIAPAFFLMTLIACLGVALWLAALNVHYRDVRYIVPFLVQVWLFATPVVYPSSLIPSSWVNLYALNPMVGAITGFRWALLGTPAPSTQMVAISSASAIAFLVSGYIFFRLTEQSFADVV